MMEEILFLILENSKEYKNIRNIIIVQILFETNLNCFYNFGLLKKGWTNCYIFIDSHISFI